jgi:hypothetical protein
MSGIDAAALYAELRVLARGRGVRAARIDDQVGPTLRAAAGLDGAAGGALRAALSTWLRVGCAALPDDLRVVAGVALGLDPRVDAPHLMRRIDWLAGVLGRDPRTIRRRGDDAFELLAEAAAAGLLAPGGAALSEDSAAPQPEPTVEADDSPAPREHRPTGGGVGWYVALVTAVMKLDGPATQLYERRRIVAVEADLSEVVLSMSLPPSPGAPQPPRGLDMEVLYGARAAGVERLGESHYSVALRLPRPLAVGQAHEFAYVWRLPAGEQMAPRYALNPTVRCDALDLRVRFPDGAAVRVERVDGLPLRAVDDSGLDLPRVDLDGVGEARAHFGPLLLGFSYGLRWAAA